MSNQMRRCSTAVALVVLAIIGAITIQDLVAARSTPVYRAVEGTFIQQDERGEQVSAAMLLDAALKNTGMGLQSGSGALPEQFEEELFDVDEFTSVQVDSSKGVIGLVGGSDRESVLEWCSGQMMSKGWISVGVSNGSGLSFVKKQGVYRWAFLNATVVGDQISSVVVLA